MQTIETKIDKWDGGIENDPRDPQENTCRVVSNFDIITNPRKMTPYRSSESGDGAASTSQKQNFCIALRTGTTYSLYALGVVSGTARAEILFKNLTTGAATDLDDSGWDTPAANQSASGSTNFDLFVYYQRTGFIYGAKAGNSIWRFDPAGTAFVEQTQAITYTNIAQGLVHSKDDILYVPYDNKIAKNDNGTWTAIALTLPAHLYIRSISEYGSYLAIACSPLSGFGNSRVYLWDRDSSLTTISESIDWGSGVLNVLEEIDGELIGISLHKNIANFADKVIFRKLSGNVAVKFKEIRGGSNTTQLLIKKQKINNRLYFMMLIEYNGAVRDGVWSIGRIADGQFNLLHERTSNNDTALTTGNAIKGFFFVDDFLFISYQTTDFALTKTDDTAIFSHNSVYESKRFGSDASTYKDLKEVTITTEYLPTAGQITLQYRADEETAWKTIFVNTTDNSISHTAKNFEGRTATMTIASPAVVTLTAHGLAAGDMIYFTTTGALPTGVSADTTYFVISTGLATDSFQFSATSGGSAVNSSGTQSGTHTLIRRNAALPNDYKEIEFRIVSTGNAEPTGLIFKEEIKGRRFNTA